ncbi:MAG: D-tyrosyl-tRNA(Tyr) deacylase [Elusimicrobia bacterium]|nr:D-tyrosyl-tRNA(Tyr) deacylase [Elusimicrobiota bacterium]
MRAVIQRVSEASLTSGDYAVRIGSGLLVLVAVSKDDTARDVDYTVDKTLNLRIFSDEKGKLNLSVRDVSGEILAVSQFTLYGDSRKGRRPSFDKSADREKGKEFFDMYADKLKREGIKVETGLFGEEMKVRLVNDGPVTLIIDSNVS